MFLLKNIQAAQKGHQQKNLPRNVAMYLCQKCCDMSLQEIAEMLNLEHKGEVSNALTNVLRLFSEE